MAFCVNLSDHDSLIQTVTTILSSSQTIVRGAIIQLPTSSAEPILNFLAASNITIHNISNRARASRNSIAHSRSGEQKSRGSTNLKTRPVIIETIHQKSQDGRTPATVFLLATFSNHDGSVPDISGFPKLLQLFLVRIYPPMTKDSPIEFPHMHTTPPWGGLVHAQYVLALPLKLHLPANPQLWVDSRGSGSGYRVSDEAHLKLENFSVTKMREWAKMDQQKRKDWALEYLVCYTYLSTRLEH